VVVLETGSPLEQSAQAGDEVPLEEGVEVVRRILLWLALGVLIVYIIYRPGMSADVFMSVGSQVTVVVEAILQFFSSLEG